MTKEEYKVEDSKILKMAREYAGLFRLDFEELYQFFWEYRRRYWKKEKLSYYLLLLKYVEQNKHNKKIRSLEKKNIKAWHDSKGHDEGTTNDDEMSDSDNGDVSRLHPIIKNGILRIPYTDDELDREAELEQYLSERTNDLVHDLTLAMCYKWDRYYIARDLVRGYDYQLTAPDEIKCLNCGKPFPYRSNKKYCSDKCRKVANNSDGFFCSIVCDSVGV